MIPDLCVEVVSKDDHVNMIEEKVVYFLTNGATLVWLVYLKMRRVETYRREDVVIVLSEDDVLDGGDVLPGFMLPVRDIFNEGI